MINNLKDLVKFTHHCFKNLGSKEYFKDILIEKRDLMDTLSKSFEQQLAFLPLTYIDIIKKIDVTGVLLGGFCLSPSSLKNEAIDKQLLKSGDDPFFPKEFMEKHNMFQIGSYNTDLLCLTKGTDHFKEGEVLFVEEGYDIYNPQDSQIYRLAKDFEQFLIVAGNLSQIHGEIHKDNSNLEEKKAEFIERLKTLGVSEEYHQAWLSVF